MRPVAPLINVPPKLYKHFAVVTLALTACVAMFARAEAPYEPKPKEASLAKPAPKPTVAAFGNGRIVEGLIDNRASTYDYGSEEPVASLVPISASALTAGEEPSLQLLKTMGLDGIPTLPVQKRRKRPPVLPPGAPEVPEDDGSAASPPMPPPSEGV